MLIVHTISNTQLSKGKGNIMMHLSLSRIFIENHILMIPISCEVRINLALQIIAVCHHCRYLAYPCSTYVTGFTVERLHFMLYTMLFFHCVLLSAL